MYSKTDSLVSTDWLLEHLDAPDIRIVDASWYMPDEGRDPRAEYAQEHIPGAVFFDIDEIADLDNPLPHMLPDASSTNITSVLEKLSFARHSGCKHCSFHTITHQERRSQPAIIRLTDTFPRPPGPIIGANPAARS